MRKDNPLLIHKRGYLGIAVQYNYSTIINFALNRIETAQE